MMDRRKKQNAYIRVNKKGQIAPASLMYRDKAPTGAKFKEMTIPYPQLCCGHGCRVNEHFVDTVYGDSYSNRLYGIHSGIDADCNTYLLYFQVEPTGEPVNEEDGNSWYGVLKQSSDGTILWQKQINSYYYNNGDWFEPYQILVNDATKRFFLIGETAVMCVDLDGNDVWFRGFDQVDANISLYISTGYVAPDGSAVYIGGTYSGVQYANYIVKIDAATGAIVKQVINNYNESPLYASDIYGVTGDAFGNVIAPLNMYGVQPGGGPDVIMFKFDKDLNEIWKARTSPTATPGTYGDSPAVDYAGNVYMYTYWINTPGEDDNGWIKLNGETGELEYRGKLFMNDGVNNNYRWNGDMRFDEKNDAYFIFDSALTFFPSYQSTFNAVKVKYDGSAVKFWYQFYDNSGLEPNQYFYWWNTAICGPNVVSGNLLFPAYSNQYSGWLYKLPTHLMNGTYDNVTFTPFGDYEFSTIKTSLGPATVTGFSVDTFLAPYFVPYNGNLADAPGPIPTITKLPS